MRTRDRAARTARDARRTRPRTGPNARRTRAAAGVAAACGIALAACSPSGPSATSSPATAVESGTGSSAGPASPGGVDPAATSPAAPTTFPAAVAEQLDAAIAQAMAAANVPGALVGIWSPEGTYVKAFGVADKATGAPMDTGLFLRIGSETKTFTVTALLQLVDQGKVGLDDPIGTYIPGVPNGDVVTIRQLAEMRSGLPSYSASEQFGIAYLGNTQRHFEPEELLAFAFEMPVLGPPGTAFNYSNTNTVLLGVLVEKVSGQPFGEYLQEHIFDPVGLTSTSYPTDAALPSPHAQGYTEQTADGQEAVATDWNPSWAGPAGAMISTLADLGVWAEVLATGSLLTPETQAQRLQAMPIAPDLPDVRYGLGLFDDRGWLGHNGSLPGYQSLTMHLPEADTSFVVMLNTDIGAPVEGGTAIADPSTVMGAAITSIISPDHVFTLPSRPAPPAGEIDDGEN